MVLNGFGDTTHTDEFELPRTPASVGLPDLCSVTSIPASMVSIADPRFRNISQTPRKDDLPAWQWIVPQQGDWQIRCIAVRLLPPPQPPVINRIAVKTFISSADLF
jgi:hypothetical protein